MNLIQEALDSQTPFGRAFHAYATIFCRQGLQICSCGLFGWIKVVVFSRCRSQRLEFQPIDFFVALEAKVDDAELTINYVNP